MFNTHNSKTLTNLYRLVVLGKNEKKKKKKKSNLPLRSNTRKSAVCHLFLLKQAWTNSAPDADRARLGAQSLLDALEFSGAHILTCKKEKNIRSTSF